jgi:hypothetical protein
VIGLHGGQDQFRDDDGSADPAVAAALAAFAAGHGSEHEALTALAAARLLVPLVATVGQDVTSHQSDMAVPTVVGHDGRAAILAFTCVDAVARWRRDARPVPEEAGRVWRAAVAESGAVVIDIAGPVPLAVDGARLAALAARQPVPLPHEDQDVQAAVREAAAASPPAITRLDLAVGNEGSDLAIQVTLAPGCSRAAAQDAVGRLGAGLMEALGGRLRRGIAIGAAPSRPDAAGYRG